MIKNAHENEIKSFSWQSPKANSLPNAVNPMAESHTQTALPHR